MPDRPTAERGHLPASIFERNRVLRRRNHPKTSENLIFCELRNFNSETSSLVTLSSCGESAKNRFLSGAAGREPRLSRRCARLGGPLSARGYFCSMHYRNK